MHNSQCYDANRTEKKERKKFRLNFSKNKNSNYSVVFENQGRNVGEICTLCDLLC